MHQEQIELMNSFSKLLKLKGRQIATIESYCRDVKNFLEFTQTHKLSIGNVTAQTLVDFQRYLGDELGEKENSIRRAVIGVRQYFKFLESEKLITYSPLDLVVIPPRNEDLPLDLTEEKFDKLFVATEQTTPAIKSFRDAAIISLLGLEGLKANEIINLKWNDYLNEKGRGSLKIAGNRPRLLLLNKKTTIMLERYHVEYKKIPLPKKISNFIFIAFKGRDASLVSSSISRHGIKFMLMELGSQCNQANLNTELLRHHAINFLINEGKTPEEIMIHLGLKRIGNIAKHIAKQTKRLN